MRPSRRARLDGFDRLRLMCAGIGWPGGGASWGRSDLRGVLTLAVLGLWLCRPPCRSEESWLATVRIPAPRHADTVPLRQALDWVAQSAYSVSREHSPLVVLENPDDSRWDVGVGPQDAFRVGQGSMEALEVRVYLDRLENLVPGLQVTVAGSDLLARFLVPAPSTLRILALSEALSIAVHRLARAHEGGLHAWFRSQGLAASGGNRAVLRGQYVYLVGDPQELSLLEARLAIVARELEMDKSPGLAGLDPVQCPEGAAAAWCRKGSFHIGRVEPSNGSVLGASGPMDVEGRPSRGLRFTHHENGRLHELGYYEAMERVLHGPAELLDPAGHFGLAGRLNLDEELHALALIFLLELYAPRLPGEMAEERAWAYRQIREVAARAGPRAAPSVAVAWFNEGMALAAAGDGPSGVAALGRALGTPLEPEGRGEMDGLFQGHAALAMGRILKGMGDLEGATTWMRRAVGVFLGFADTHPARRYASRWPGSGPDAEDTVPGPYSIETYWLEASRELAEIMLAMGRSSDAEPLLLGVLGTWRRKFGTEGRAAELAEPSMRALVEAQKQSGGRGSVE